MKRTNLIKTDVHCYESYSLEDDGVVYNIDVRSSKKEGYKKYVISCQTEHGLFTSSSVVNDQLILIQSKEWFHKYLLKVYKTHLNKEVENKTYLQG